MDSFEKRLVEAVRRKREAEGLSIRALSSLVGVSFSTLARIERGEGLPDNNSKIRLLEWLGPDGEEAGLTFDRVAFVHFRAAKNVRSPTVHALLRSADLIRRNSGVSFSGESSAAPHQGNEAVTLSKEELEETADRFRKDLGLSPGQPLDSLRVEVEGILLFKLTETKCLERALVKHLSIDACDEWSAMSVPLNQGEDTWAVLLNDCHTVERQRVTLMEECWHILLGHKLTKIARVADGYGRTYDQAEEHDAFYLASATLLPRSAMIDAVSDRSTSADIARKFGTSAELVDYRLKRLGLWREHVGKRIALSSD
ncbi:helix-turn-helix domain-containing protein [Bradyrhizobium japonicum]|uniref:helix-turn-helix domain-containing protein n=1 Tax=Bradyrhizobium japonicum TaxID=375 RepID=UPI001E511E89|nr:XRE family transcriptional regulator [Bradyrhizobium japonicum]MCD9892085.1 XRE family transcriptional regulator [Bradyrhizobium japonicum]WRJ83885.1 XRE family transcriptional regulator [Bradyrhizobium japonicum]WRK46705.1 XRE family transcriptional regulator [Bradyrhizobium japonicum]